MISDSLATAVSRSTPRLVVVVSLALLLLFITTAFLTGAYRHEKEVRAHRQFQAAERLAIAGRYEESIDQYAAALRLKRESVEYKQALAQALMETGRIEEAESYFREIAAQDPSNGTVNLMLARIRAMRGEVEEAVQYYQRAAYGVWEEDPIDNRIRVHFELIELLAENRQKTLVEAELLRVLEEVPDNPEMKKRIAGMFLEVDAPHEARELFSQLTEHDPKDAEAWAGLGDAEFALRRYLSARTAYRNAVRLNKEDTHSRIQLELVSDVVNLDPMRRGLGIATRLEKSRTLVKRALASLDYCFGENLDAFPPSFQKDVEQARQVAAGGAHQRLEDEYVEANIALAERLHSAKPSLCGQPPVPDVALDLVLKELAG